MISITVEVEEQYQVIICSDWSSQLGKLVAGRERVAVIVSDGFIPDLTSLTKLDCELHVFQVPDGEAGKTIDSLSTLWNWLGAIGLTRSDLIIGVGGGAVTDLAGFAAASWLRGIDWVGVPTHWLEWLMQQLAARPASIRITEKI